MDDITISLLVVLITAIIIGGIFVLAYYRKRNTQQLVINLATQRGWRYEKVNDRTTSGYRLYGPQWVFEGLRETSESSSNSGSSNVRSFTRWYSTQVNFTPGILLIGPKQPEINLGGISDVIKQAMLKLMVGDEADDALGIEESLIGRMSLRERYMVWTNQEEKARDVLTPEVENALIRYPGKIPPVVKFNAKGIEVKLISQHLEKPDEIEGFVAIGKAFLL